MVVEEVWTRLQRQMGRPVELPIHAVRSNNAVLKRPPNGSQLRPEIAAALQEAARKAVLETGLINEQQIEAKVLPTIVLYPKAADPDCATVSVKALRVYLREVPKEFRLPDLKEWAGWLKRRDERENPSVAAEPDAGPEALEENFHGGGGHQRKFAVLPSAAMAVVGVVETGAVPVLVKSGATVAWETKPEGYKFLYLYHRSAGGFELKDRWKAGQ